jgi:hypothetical protein
MRQMRSHSRPHTRFGTPVVRAQTVNRVARICSGLIFERRAMLRFYFLRHPQCGHKIYPAELRYVHGKRCRCPQCGAVFEPETKKPEPEAGLYLRLRYPSEPIVASVSKALARALPSRERIPNARAIQQLVQAWKLLRQWRETSRL